jgi:methionyl-tRNA formyltransferase
MRSRIALIGNGSFAVGCLQALLRRPEAEVGLVICDPNAHAMRGLVSRFCRDAGIAAIESANANAPETLDAIRAVEPDLLFSAYNMQILRQRLLDIPRAGTVNFHNGPLPRYRGVNVYSWAIINGETEYGSSWHWVDQGIDSGDVLAQKMFPIDPQETPTTLIAKGFRTGIESLEELLPALLAGQAVATEQDESLATYYRKRDLPNGGRISFAWTYERLERFVRGLDFRPLPNTFVYPTIARGGASVFAQRVSMVARTVTATPGAILRSNDRAIHVQASDAVVAISEILGPDHEPISARSALDRLGVAPGDRFEDVDQGTTTIPGGG